MSFFCSGIQTTRNHRYLSRFVKYTIARGHSSNKYVNRVRESDLAALRQRGLRLIDTHLDDPDQLKSDTLTDPGFRLIRLRQIVIYKVKELSPGGRQITFPNSIHIFIEAMAPGHIIFDKTEEIAVLSWSFDAATKKEHLLRHLSTLSDQNRSSAPYTENFTKS